MLEHFKYALYQFIYYCVLYYYSRIYHVRFWCLSIQIKLEDIKIQFNSEVS